MKNTDLKRRLKQISALVFLKRTVLDGWVKGFWHFAKRVVNIRHARIIESFPLYMPNSFMSYKNTADLTVLNANQIFPFMVRLARITGKSRLPAAVPVQSFCADAKAKGLALELKSSFDKCGSDKGNSHDYHLIYGAIIKDKNAVTAMLEIGLGTNNTDVPSNMGAGAKPGASIRAFRDVFKNAVVYGADVDKRILFEEERIKTFYVDQTDPKTFDELSARIGEKLDLIIDDGLHALNANIATLSFALGKLKQGGWFVVEDINATALPAWHVAAALLSPEFKPQMILTAKNNYVFLVQRF